MGRRREGYVEGYDWVREGGNVEGKETGKGRGEGELECMGWGQ